MSKNNILVSLFELIFLIAGICATPIANEVKSNAKGSIQSSGKFAAPLTEQDVARTHSSPWRQQPFYNNQFQHSRIWPQMNFPTHLPLIHKLPVSFLHKPSLIPFHQPAAEVPVIPAVQPVPTKPAVSILPQFVHEPVFSKPSVPSIPIYPSIISQSKPPLPYVAEKPTLVVSQQVIHKPIVTENIEVIRRPVLTEVVQVVHKPVVHEEVQVIKIPTYSQHVVKKPVLTQPITNELPGTPIHLPSQHYTFQEKPQIMSPVTTQVVQIPHHNTASHGSIGYGSGYETESAIKPTNYLVGSNYGGVGASYGIPSYSVGSSYGGIGASYGTPSYSAGTSYGGIGTSYGKPSYGIGASYGGYGGVHDYGYGGIGSGYTPSSGIGTGYLGLLSNYGVSPGYGLESEGIAHSFVEPVASCKSGSCKPTMNEDLTYEGTQPIYSPSLWYSLPSLYAPPLQTQYGRNMMEDYEEAARYPFLVPMSDIAKVQEFLEDPNTRMDLQTMFQNYLERNATPTENLSTDKPKKEKSSDEDANTPDKGEDKADEKEVSMVLNAMKTFTPASLKKVEEAMKEIQYEVANGVGSKMSTSEMKLTTESIPSSTKKSEIA